MALAEEPRQVVIGTRAIPYTLKVSAQAKRMRVTIANGQVSVTVPRGLRLFSVDRFLQEHGQWILAKLEQASRRKVQPSLPKNVVLVTGVPMRIVRVEDLDRESRARVVVWKDRLVVRVPAGSQADALGIVEAWLRKQARSVISAEVKRQAFRMQAFPAGISIRDQRTRWGSCSGKDALSFSWRLVMAPRAVMQYVIVHELAHTFQHNHSKEFWAVVASYAPEYKQHRAWLRKNGSLLRPQA